MTNPDSIPVNMVTGFLGVGKTTAILELLKHRPAGGQWAVLVNEFGKVPIDQAALSGGGGEDIQISEVAGGCLCCTAGVNMQAALTQLIERARPDRIIIEPTGLGHPERLKELVTAGKYPCDLELRTTLCLVDVRQYLNPRFVHLYAYWEQVKAADVVVINKADVAEADEVEACRDRIRESYPEVEHILVTEQGRLDPEWLDAGTPADAAPAGAPSAGQDHVHHASSEPEAVVIAGGRGRRLESEGLDRHACGWIFDPEMQFDREALEDWLKQLHSNPVSPEHPEALRAKGIFHTAGGWVHFNAVGQEESWTGVPASVDSRIEIISAEGRLDWQTLEQRLLACIRD